ncbi:MAG: hypothetical protein CMD96_04825 [Gammaproteobacteria bacterium]|jgi:uncharacterized NAD-dependent epimerase/dehydratase family protein|nr:hypothetical protein [Gammaproteobacteria bacterium]MBQ09093.1 hypothetical protein [Gammaproteobacteria bacterium]
MKDIYGTALLYSGGLLDDIHAKTAHGLLRYSDRFKILGLIDQKFNGSMSADLVEHCKENLMIYKDLSAALEQLPEKPKYLVMGVAFGGGMLPEEHRLIVKDALSHGMDVVCGLHQLLSEDSELAGLAEKNGAEIHDIRKPKKAEELRFWSGEIKAIQIPTIAVLGTDCATGKRTMCQFLVEALRESGTKTEVIYTGQTGFLQGFKHGLILDSTLNDFVSGELEKAIIDCATKEKPDLMLIEGQSSLRNPSGPCGSEILLSGNIDAVVLAHPAERKYFDNCEAAEAIIPGIEDEIELIRHYGKEVIGIAINASESFDTSSLKDELGIPVLNPIFEDISPLVDKITSTLITG